MNSESFLHQNKVRAMGTALAIISSLALLLWVIVAVLLAVFPGSILAPGENPTSFESLAGKEAPELEAATDEELWKHFEARFEENREDLPEGVTAEVFARAMIYFFKARAGENLIVPYTDPGDPVELDPLFLPGGLSGETTVQELMLKDRAFYEAHAGAYRVFTLLGIGFYAAVAIIILRMAIAWRQGEPFGERTIRCLRWLGVLFLAELVANLVGSALIPYSGFGEVVAYSAMFDDLAANSGVGAGLSCGIVFLALAWILDHGRKMKEEQALTI